MNRPRSLPFFLVGVFAASLAGNLWQFLAAHPPRIFMTTGARPGPEDDPPPLDLAAELALSEIQRETLLDQVEELEAERADLETRLATRMDELRDEILLEEPDPSRIDALTREVADQRARIFAIRIEVLRRFGAILTPEQRDRLAQRVRR